MRSADQAAARGGWRMQLRDMRTLSALRAESPAPDAVERLSDRALRAAAHNPDHSPAARAAAAAALKARKIAIEPWRAVAPGFLRPRDLEQGLGLFFGWRRTLRAGAGAGALMAAAAAIWLAARPASAAGFASVAAGGALLLTLIWLGALLLRRPARVGVLRPMAAPGGPFSRMVRRELHAFGHVVSLDNKPGGYVRCAADYRALAARLNNRLALNFRAAVLRAPLPARASEAWRPLVLQLLAESSDVLVVDISDGGAWALDTVRGQAPRCVFVCLWGRLEEAEAALRAAGVAQPCFYYAPDGEMQRRGQFRAAMLAAMRATHGFT